jgi:hypothetical protein
MFCLLAHTRYFLNQPSFGTLVRQRSLITVTMGRQGAYKHNRYVHVLTHNLHLLKLAKPELMRTSFWAGTRHCLYYYRLQEFIKVVNDNNDRYGSLPNQENQFSRKYKSRN